MPCRQRIAAIPVASNIKVGSLSSSSGTVAGLRQGNFKALFETTRL
jgi:hypothetical protein